MGGETDKCLKSTYDFAPPTITRWGSFYAVELAEVRLRHAHRSVRCHAIDPRIIRQNEWIADAANVSTLAVRCVSADAGAEYDQRRRV